jgi:hypothetical protein
MKTLLILAILFFVTTTYAQDFQLSTSTAQGMIVGKDLQPDLFQATLEVTPTFVWDKFKVSAVTMTYTSSLQTGFLAGTRLGYNIIQSETSNFFLTGQGLLGNTGKKLVGGGLGIEFQDIMLNGNAGYEFQDEQVWLDIGIGVKIIQ